MSDYKDQTGGLQRPATAGEDERRLEADNAIRDLSAQLEDSEAHVTSLDARLTISEATGERREVILEAVIDSAPFGVHMYVLESDDKLVFFGGNRRAEEILGIRNEELIGRELEEAFPGYKGTQAALDYRTVARDGGVWESAQYSYDANGVAGVFELHAFAFGPMRVCVFFRDVTEVQALEARLGASEEVGRDQQAKHMAVLRTAMDGFWLSDSSGHLLEVNDAYCEMSGYTQQELLTMRIDELEDAQSSEEIAAIIEHLRTQRKDRFESRHRRKDGTTYPVEVSLESNGDIGFEVAAFTRDITERKRKESEMLAMVNSVIDVVTSISEARDPYTAGHERRVAELAVAIATQIGMSATVVGDIKIAAPLHDVGKTAVPAEILTRPGALSPVEFELIKSHAQCGHDILETAHMPGPITTIVLQHHERCDGSGYPNGLDSESILVESRVLMVADLAEAMMSHRPYRAALGVDAALAEIEDGAGTRYDAQVARTCIQLFRERGFQFSEAWISASVQGSDV